MLTLLKPLPLAGALSISLVNGRHEALIRSLALAASLVVFGVTLLLWAGLTVPPGLSVHRTARLDACVRHRLLRGH
jgi:NADH:ubiquinone oxidoreductase subunit 4 (subunit M)